jgi:uncharacterized protein
MQIINKTKQKILSTEVIIPKSLLDQSLGLLKHKTPVAMLLKTRYGIHTFGMRYPIDVLILDKQNHVVAIKEHLKPNRIFMWNFYFETVLELPRQTIEKTKTQIGDKILL